MMEFLGSFFEVILGVVVIILLIVFNLQKIVKFIKWVAILFVLAIVGYVFSFFTDEKGSKETYQTQSTDTYTSQLKEVRHAFESEGTEAGIEAIVEAYLLNYEANGIESLATLVHPASDFYREQEKYMQSLRTRGIDLQLVDYSIISVQQLEARVYEVITDEQFIVNHPKNGIKEVVQQIQYTVELIGNEVFITDLVVVTI